MASLEQTFDAVVGRFVNYLAGDPLRNKNRLHPPKPGEAPTGDRLEAVIGEAHEEHAAPAKKAPAGKAAAKKKKAVPKKKAPAKSTGALAKGEQGLLEALTGLGGDASLSELVKRTGETRYAVNEMLKKLQAEGFVERVGAGMKTRYERIG